MWASFSWTDGDFQSSCSVPSHLLIDSQAAHLYWLTRATHISKNNTPEKWKPWSHERHVSHVWDTTEIQKMLWKWASPRRPGLTEKSGVLMVHTEAGAQNSSLSMFAAERTRERQNWRGSCPQRPSEVNWNPDVSLFVLSVMRFPLS